VTTRDPTIGCEESKTWGQIYARLQEQQIIQNWEWKTLLLTLVNQITTGRYNFMTEHIECWFNSFLGYIVYTKTQSTMDSTHWTAKTQATQENRIDRTMEVIIC
jgi:hypothetical protein